MNPTGLRRIPPDQSSGSGHSFGSRRHPSIKDPILSKRVCFYKSGDPQFNGLRMVINNRTFKTFDALLDSLSKKVPLPFGVRNITTPRGVHAIYNLDELEDGKSYICSDSRKVKPINLALARKKLPPWYHARPVSSRRRTVQQARFFPGRNNHKQERVVVRTPKRLLVFRNGDPTVKYTVVLHKRTTPTFESILEYISELMQFHVVKLHTPDGRRVDSLPGLILCSGTVVAAGREPFRSANYNVQKSLTPTWLPTNRKGPRRLKSLNRKKKSMSYSSKSRNFSPSSEQYIVNRIHNSIAESSYDLPSNPTNSVELESSRILESVAETEGDGAEGQGCLLPAEDDIEKSFRVNQDGSMTVEMKVRLTIKEEETIHWTTTLTRSSVANQCNVSCLTEPEAEQEICSPTSNSLDPQSPADSTDSIDKDRTKDNNDEDPPSLSNGAPSESGNEEDYIKVQTDMLSPRRAPTPGYKQIIKKQASMESIKSLLAEGIQEASTFGSSSKALLAFLSVMTLKEGITNFNMDELNANNVSCAEALKMIDSLREIASIEDSHKLKVSLSNLQQSTSKQLLQSWKDFQELSNKCKSRSSTPNCSEEELITEASPEKDCGTEENVIDEIMDNLDIPEKLKVELASLSMGVKTESDDEEKMSARFMGKVELSPKDISDSEVSHSSTEDAVNVGDVTQDEKFNVDVSSIIKKFTNINQQKQSDMDSSHLITERVKHEPNDQTTTDEDSHYGQNGAVKCPPAEPVEEDREAMNSCEEENLENQETLNMNGVVSSEKDHEKESHEVECKQLQMQSEESVSIPENELTSDDESGSDDEGQDISSVNKDVEQGESCKQSVSSSEAGEQHSSEEEQLEIECEEIKQEGSEGENLSNPDSDSEEEEDKQPSSNYYVELSVSRKESISSPDSENQSLTEEEKPEVECRDLSNEDTLSYPASLPESEKVPDIQISGMGLNISVDESTGNSDEDEKSSSEEEQAEAECKELKVIIEESLSETEEEKEIIEEEEHLDDLSDHEEETRKALIEETEEDNVSSDNEDPHADKKHIFGTKDLSNLDSYTEKDSSSLIKSDSLAKRCRFNADEDSGNDHSSCEEQVEVEQIKSSVEEELSYYEKESSSEEQANMDTYTEESCKEYEEAPAQSDVTIAERVGLLEKQAADAQKRENVTDIPAIRHSSERNTHLESDAEDSPSESPTSQSTICPPSAPQSSLSFSYDSSGVITTEPEGNRVKSIREMFLAKSATDIQHGLRRFPNPNTSELRELRAETSASGGYQSQTSSELSSGEDDSARKSITKGFVRRAIERLYGKKDDNPDEDPSERPPSAPKQKKKEHSSIFSPFHIAHCKAVSELSYFNSSNALDTLSEATRCIAFNAQVGPGDSVPIDNGRWLLRENTLIRKSVSDPVGINKAFTNSPLGEGTCEDTEQNTTYSLFTTKTEVEDKTNSLTRKCTYFSLPHASDSDVCQDDLSTVSKSSANGDSVTDTKDNSEDTKTWVERNGMLPAVVTDFKMMDNKVHPLTELPSDGGVVVVQPGKGQGVVNRRLQEPDVLDFLYNFCGEHCPIL
ncbi:oxygen-regulated protein 1 [Seriola dumerili]|uniref:oxygen-regulated protein 1 n=1 Tax=Seriola dumerili TaxID=41447 RepID=UPI000BBE90E8|nr:oxygen-regulated protein 1 [Seriola dumerili]